jgi:hypothetical protein
MGKTWVLDTETKGTGANMVPLEKVQQKAEPQPRRATSTPARRPPGAGEKSARRRARPPVEPAPRTVTALPPGHVRKKATGEIGKVRSVDPRAGQAVVHWLKRGQTSTVALSAISRR